MNLKIKIQFTILLLLLSAIKAIADYKPINDFTQVDGLPCNSVNHIFEDSRGLIWLSTDAGLCEFNGYEVKYRKELNRLQGEKVNCVTEDLNGNLIIAASGVGVCEFDGENLEVLAHSKENTLNNFRSVEIFSNQLIVGTSDGIFIDDRNDDKVKFSLLNESKKLNVARTIDNGENLIIFPKLKLGSYTFKSGSFKKIINTKNQILELGSEFNGEINIGDQILLKSDKEIISCDVLNCLSGQNEKILLLRYFQNGLEYRKLILLKENFCIDFLEENDLHGVFVHSIFKHKLTGDIWLGTKNHGLIHLKQSIFTLFDVALLMPKSKYIEDFVSLYDGSLILAGNNKVVKFKNKKVLKEINHSAFQKLLPSSKKDIDVIINDIENKGDIIWIATNHGFFTLNSNSFFLKYHGITNALKFIILSNQKLFCYNGKQFITCGYNDNDPKVIHMDLSVKDKIGITKIIEFDSYIWVSTENHGIYRFGEKVVHKFGRNNSGIHNVVNDMLVLPDSSIIAGGNNGILYKLKNKGNKLIIQDSLDYRDGLEGISVHGFQYLSDGSIWCGTNLGIHRFEYKTWHPDSVLRYRFWNAKKDITFRGYESLVDENGNIWVNSNHALMKIETDAFNSDTTAYQPSLLGVKIKHNNWKSKKSEVHKWTNIPKNPIHLNYNESYVSLMYGMLYCDNLKNIRYRYRLVGLDKEWSEWKTSTEVVYSNLKGGHYNFEIEARKLSSDKTSKYSIDVMLDTAWWKTTWFWLALIIATIALSYHAIKYYRTRIRFEEKQRTKQFNRVIGLKIKALQYQLDPHFIFNSLNSIQSYILDDKEDKALEYLSDFSMVLRNNIDNANKDMISLTEELAYLKLYLKLEQMRFEEKFSFLINVDENINPHNIKMPPMLIQPFLEHAIKYGIGKLNKAGKLVIRFILEEDGYLKCEITDNGLGNRKIDIEKSEFVKDNSLQITCDRMKLLNKVLTNGRTYSYQINEFIDSKTQFSGVKTELGFPKL